MLEMEPAGEHKRTEGSPSCRCHGPADACEVGLHCLSCLTNGSAVVGQEVQHNTSDEGGFAYAGGWLIRNGATPSSADTTRSSNLDRYLVPKRPSRSEPLAPPQP